MIELDLGANIDIIRYFTVNVCISMTKKTAFFIEGLNHQTGLGTDKICEYLKSLSLRDFSKHQNSGKVSAIAHYNGLLKFDPIEGYNNPNVIYNFITGLEGSKAHKAMIFELIVMRAAKEFVVQILPPATLNSQGEILQLIKGIYASDMPINDISPNFIPQIAKAFIKLKDAGHFKDTYYPNSVYKGTTYSLKKAAQHIEKHYQIPDITYGMEFIVNLDQYIGKKITPKLLKICNDNSKANLQNIVAENPDMDEIYAYIGANHLNIFSDDLAIQPNSGHKKHDPIHLDVIIEDKVIKLHLFPDSHLDSHTYRSFKAYAGKHAIKIPKLNKLKAIVTKLGCEAKHEPLSKYYFSDEELGFLICTTVENYSNYTEKQCDSVLDEITNAPSSFALCSVPKEEVNPNYWWYQDFMAREICSAESVQQHDEL